MKQLFKAAENNWNPMTHTEEGVSDFSGPFGSSEIWDKTKQLH